ncbi:MAG: hypothetical protein QHH05_02045 [Syntrophomonadaceae bacterium]|nr:hypothetical protein [Syntrophomonadaceae bacterium]
MHPGFWLLAIVAVLSLAVVLLLLAGGWPARRRYLAPWDPRYASRFSDPRTRVVAHAMLAPNSHNMQAWTVRLDPQDRATFWLHADPRRLTPLVDPYARQTTLSQGTFLEFAAVAARHLGYRASIALFPLGEYDASGHPADMKEKPVARVTLEESGESGHPLYRHLFAPHTWRVPYLREQLTHAQLQELLALNAEDELQLVLYHDPSEVQRLGALALAAAQVEGDLARITEDNQRLFRANERQKNAYRYGFSLEGQGMSGLPMYLLQGLMTVLPALNSAAAARRSFLQLTREAIAHTPMYGLIRSRGNSRTLQVKAGVLYARAQLHLAGMGFALHPLSQALQEYPEMSDLYRAIHQEFAGPGETIQMLFRVGRPLRPVPRSMRRDAMCIVVGS